MKNYFKLSSVTPRGKDFIIGSELMSRIDDLAPSDANVTAIIQQLADGTYLTRIPVRAADGVFADGQFYSEAKNGSLLASLRAAQVEILNKLSEWKRNRF